MMNRVLMQNAVDDVAEGLAFLSDSISNFSKAVDNKMSIMNNIILETKQTIHKNNATAELEPQMMKEKMGLK